MNNESNENNVPTDRLQLEECNVFSVVSLTKNFFLIHKLYIFMKKNWENPIEGLYSK